MWSHRKRAKPLGPSPAIWPKGQAERADPSIPAPGPAAGSVVAMPMQKGPRSLTRARPRIVTLPPNQDQYTLRIGERQIKKATATETDLNAETAESTERTPRTACLVTGTTGEACLAPTGQQRTPRGRRGGDRTVGLRSCASARRAPQAPPPAAPAWRVRAWVPACRGRQGRL